MLPDYSAFSGDPVAIAVKITKTARNGRCYLTIECVAPAKGSSNLDRICAGFDAMMRSQSPIPPLYEEVSNGNDALESVVESLDSYYNRVNEVGTNDYSKSN